MKTTHWSVPHGEVLCKNQQITLKISIIISRKNYQDQLLPEKLHSLLNVLMKRSHQWTCYFPAKPAQIAPTLGVTSTVDAVEEQPLLREIFPLLMKIPEQSLLFKNKAKVFASHLLM